MKDIFNCYKLTDKPDFEYTKTPKKLLHAKISAHARILCIAMLERLSLSFSNKWSDENGNVYIFYTVKEAMELLGCSKPKAVSVFAELDGTFIKRKHQGLGKADIIYICKNFDADKTTPDLSTKSVENSEKDSAECYYEEFRKDKNETSGISKIILPEVKSFNPNNINNNKNNINKNNIIYHIYHYLEGG